MKLATLREGGRDGALVVVSRDLRKAVRVGDHYPTLQAALDAWDEAEAFLREVSDGLNGGNRADSFTLDPTSLLAPLPRAYQWLDASAYLNHVELVRKSRGGELPERLLDDPLMYQGGSDCFLGPRDAIVVTSEDYGIDFEAEIAAVVTDVPMGANEDMAADSIALLMLVNDVSLRGLIPEELAKGFGFIHGKPPTAFSPVAVTPDELGAAWDGNTIHRPIEVIWNGKEFGRPNAGVDMNFSLPRLIAHGAKTRPLMAGTIVGSGTVSNRGGQDGYACIAEIRAVELIEKGEPATGFMKFGDTIRIDMQDTDGNSIFGAIEQRVAAGN